VNKQITIDGYDKVSKCTIKNIAIFYDYHDRNAGCFYIRNGKHAKLIHDYGDYVQIKRFFKTGFITKWFIRELKNASDNNNML
jgi:hypothetical protein